MAAYAHLGNNIYVGITTDTKPTAANTANGAIAIEWATNFAKYIIYVNDQTTWNPQTEFAETIKNKTLDSTNTISSATSLPTVSIAKGGTGQTTASAAFDALSGLTAAGDLIIGGASGARSKLVIGTANQLLRVNAGATAPEYASTLSGLTLTSPTINGATLATSTIDAQSNTLYNVDFLPSVKKSGIWTGVLQTTGASGLFAGNVTATAVGTGSTSTAIRDSTGFAFKWTTGGTINSIGGIRFGAGSGVFTERDLNPYLLARIVLTQTTDSRMVFGYTSAVTAPASATDPYNGLSGVAFFYDSSVDGNWHIMQNDGSGASDRTTIANVAAADTSVHVFGIRADNANTKFQYYYGSSAPTLASTWNDVNTDIPAAGTGLGIRMDMENLAGTPKLFSCYYVQHVQDG
jgi:hypothetical protein